MLQRHRHEYKQDGRYLICTCGKRILNLKQLEEDNLMIGQKIDGKSYTVRKDRHRYFFPQEWLDFIKNVKHKKHRFFFLTCLHTGGRIMEVLNLKYENIDVDRGTINFKVVKQRKAKKNFYASGKTRGFFVSSEFLKEFKSYTRGNKFKPSDYIFLDNETLPDNYSKLDNSEKKIYYGKRLVSYSHLFKRHLKNSGIKDWKNFSPHNIRKTYGMWMRTFKIEMAELCYRMGHDMDTYLAHYGSSLIFTDNETRMINKILGEVK